MSPESEQSTEEMLHHAKVEIARLRGQLEAMKQTPSWRLTKPLRGLDRLFRNLTAKKS
jgi:hypothetical protein